MILQKHSAIFLSVRGVLPMVLLSLVALRAPAFCGG